MEMTAGTGKSRRQKGKDRKKRVKKQSHFRTVRFGGFDESQMICYLWDMAKSMDIARQDRAHVTEHLAELGNEMRRRVRVEMRRYFLRCKRRNMVMALGGMTLVACVVCLFTFLIGIDRVSGNSMYPYLNHGDLIVYSRVGAEIHRDEVIVFEKKGESMVKRVVGLPGDTVEISASGKRVVVNGSEIRQSYLALSDADSVSSHAPGTEKYGEKELTGAPLMVLNGQYLVLGDNREESIDSRSSEGGTVAKDEILGRAVLIVRVRN